MIPSTVRIFVCTEPQDMRRSFDGLALAARQVLGQDPRSGALFVFANRRGRQLRVLWWDGNGYSLLCKRLHQALFQLPKPGDPSDRSVIIDRRDLNELIRGVPTRVEIEVLPIEVQTGRGDPLILKQFRRTDAALYRGDQGGARRCVPRRSSRIGSVRPRGLVAGAAHAHAWAQRAPGGLTGHQYI